MSNDKPRVTYTIQGHFTSSANQSCFAVLRGAKDANSTSLFERRHELYLSATSVDAHARLGSVTCPGTGGLNYDRWNNISGIAIADLLSKTNNLLASPSLSLSLGSFEAPANVADNYGIRLRGYLCPPTTGVYYFWIAGDDNVSLRLSASGSEPTSASQIAYHSSSTGARVWSRFAEQKSGGISLLAGQPYYVEALMKEGGGSDNLAVGWAKPGESTAGPSEVIGGQYLIPFVAFAPPVSCSLVAVASPGSITAGSSTLTVSGGGSGAVYSWKAGGSVVGSGSSLSVTPAISTTYQVECTGCGSCTATQVTVTVSATQPPPPQLIVSPSQISWTKAASSQVVSVTSSAAWSLSGLPAEGWLTSSSSASSGSGSGGFTLSGQANTSASSRSAQVVVSSGSLSQTLTLTQAGGTGGGVVADKCYTIQNQQSLNYVQRQSDNTVRLAGRLAGENAQLWKAVGEGSAFRLVSQGNTSGEVLYVNSPDCGQVLRVGSYVNDALHRWTLEAASPGIYRVQTQEKTWDQRSGGGDPTLQMCGDNNAGDGYFNKAFRLFRFSEEACPVAGGGCSLVAVATPGSITAGGSSSLSVSGGGSGAVYSWRAGGGVVGSGAGLTVTPGSTTTYQVECTGCGSCSAAQVTVNVTATQPLPPQLTVSPSQISWGNNASSQGIDVASNVAWNVAGTPADAWLTVSVGSGNGNGTVNLSASANTATTTRTATLTIIGGNLRQTVSISQAGVSSSQPVYDLTKNYWYGMTILGRSAQQVISDPIGKQYIDASVQHGVNYLKVYLYWDETQTGPSTYDWSYLDAHYAYALQNSLKVQVHLVLTRNMNGVHYPVFDDAGIAVDNFGVPSHRSNNAIISLNHAETVARAVAFVQKVAHYLDDNHTYRDNLIGFSIGISSQAEVNYDYGNYPKGATTGERNTEYDWHSASIAKYQSRLQTWLGGSLAKYNSLKGCPATVTSWTQIMPPTPRNVEPTPEDGVAYNTDTRKLWYLHRHLSLKEFLATVYGAVRDINPLWNLMVVFPSLDANYLSWPGTLGGTRMVPDFVSIVKVNGIPGGDQNRVANLALRDRAPHRVYQTEIGPFTEDPGGCVDQGRKCFEYDGTMVNVGGGTIPGDAYGTRLAEGLNILTTTLDGITALYPSGGIAHPRRTPADNATNVRLSLYTGLEKNWNQPDFVGPYIRVDGSVNGSYGNKPVVVQIDIDLLDKILTK